MKKMRKRGSFLSMENLLVNEEDEDNESNDSETPKEKK